MGKRIVLGAVAILLVIAAAYASSMWRRKSAPWAGPAHLLLPRGQRLGRTARLFCVLHWEPDVRVEA